MASAASESKIVIKAQDEVSATVENIHSKLMGLQNPLGSMSRKLSEVVNHASVGKLGDSFSNLNAKLATVGLGAGLAGFGIAAGVAKAFQSVIDVAGKAERIQDLGGKLRLNPEEFQVIEKMAKESGTSIEEVGGAIGKFRYNLQTAQSEGGQKLAKLTSDLEAFGLTAKDVQTLKPMDLLQKMGNVSSASGTDRDQELKIAKFRDLMGRQGAAVIPVIEAMKDYKAVRDKMDAGGTLINAEQVQMGDAAAKSWERAKTAMGSLNTVFGLAVMPAFQRFSEILETRVKANRKQLQPVFEELGKSINSGVEPLLNQLESLVKGASTGVRALATLANSFGVVNLALGFAAVAAAPFIAAMFSVGTSIWGIVAFAWKLVGVPLTSWLMSTTAATTAMGAATNVAWASVFLPLTIGAAAIALVAANINEIGEYLQGVSKRVTEATNAGGVFIGIWQMIKEVAFGAINSIIGGLNTLSNLLAKIGIFETGGELRLVGAGIEGQGDRLAAKRLAEQSAGGVGGIPATTPATGRQEVNGTVRLQLDKGLVPVDVKSDNKSFSIDVLSGPMYATGA